MEGQLIRPYRGAPPDTREARTPYQVALDMIAGRKTFGGFAGSAVTYGASAALAIPGPFPGALYYCIDTRQYHRWTLNAGWVRA